MLGTSDTGGNIHVCADISLFFFLPGQGAGSVLMGNGSNAAICGIGAVDLKFTLGKTVQLRNVQHFPSINKNLVSGSLFCKDGLKLVFESNKCVVFKFGSFVGKGYDCDGLFGLSLLDSCNKVVNHVCNDD
jgi:hypothetical protein